MGLYDAARLTAVSCPVLQTVAGDLYLQSNPVLARVELPRLVAVGGFVRLQSNPLLATTGVSVSPGFAKHGFAYTTRTTNYFYAFSSGFACTTDNGLKAVLAACKAAAGCTPRATQVTVVETLWPHAVAAVGVNGGRVTEVTDGGGCWRRQSLLSVSVEAC